MRIALVCPYSVSFPGGVREQVLGLASALRDLDHHVDVVAPCDGPVPEGVIAVGSSLRFRVNGSTAPMAPTPAAAWRTIRALRGGRYDVIHVHEPMAPSITLPTLIAKPAPLIGTFHAAGDRTPYRWAAPLLRPLARRLDTRVAVSGAAGHLAESHLGGTYETLFNGIDLRRYAAATTQARASDLPVILFLGRHDPRKGLAVLLEAFTGLPTNASLWVAGDGPQTSRLLDRFGRDRRIHWVGTLDDNAKIDALRRASVMCAPSLHGESFGMVLLEAMAAGCPVVASDLPGYRAVVAGDEDAIAFVEPGDPLDLRAALLGLLGDGSRASLMRAAGLDVARRYDLTALASHYVRLYEAIA